MNRKAGQESVFTIIRIKFKAALLGEPGNPSRLSRLLRWFRGLFASKQQNTSSATRIDNTQEGSDIDQRNSPSNDRMQNAAPHDIRSEKQIAMHLATAAIEQRGKLRHVGDPEKPYLETPKEEAVVTETSHAPSSELTHGSPEGRGSSPAKH